MLTAFGAEDGGRIGRVLLQELTMLFGRHIGLATVGTEHPHQPLRHDTDKTGGDQERLDAHVHQTGNGTHGGIGVQGGQHQVPGQTCLNGNLRSFQIPDFPDHHHIRILAQNGSQAPSKGHIHFRVHLGLTNARQVVLDRILDRQYVAAAIIDFLQRGVKRGGFTGTCGACHQQNTVRTIDQLAQGFQILPGHAE